MMHIIDMYAKSNIPKPQWDIKIELFQVSVRETICCSNADSGLVIHKTKWIDLKKTIRR